MTQIQDKSASPQVGQIQESSIVKWKVQPYGKLPLWAIPESAGTDFVMPEETLVLAERQATVILGIGTVVPHGSDILNLHAGEKMEGESSHSSECPALSVVLSQNYIVKVRSCSLVTREARP